jgi:hypothetical protein
MRSGYRSREALLERAITPAEAVRGARALFRAPRQAARSVVDMLEAAGALARTGMAVPASSFNVAIGPYRRLAVVHGDLGRFVPRAWHRAPCVAQSVAQRAWERRIPHTHAGPGPIGHG